MNPSPPRDLVITAANASSPHFERCPHPRDGDRFTCPECRAAFDTAHYALAAALPEVERKIRAGIVAGIRHYFSPVDSYDDMDVQDDVRILCGRIERGEY